MLKNLKTGVDDFEELSALPEEKRAAVIRDLKKGRHFAAFYSNMLATLVGLGTGFAVISYLEGSSFLVKAAVLVALLWPLRLLYDAYYWNVVAGRVIRDLIAAQGD